MALDNISSTIDTLNYSSIRKIVESITEIQMSTLESITMLETMYTMEELNNVEED